MLVKKIGEYICEDWEDVTYFINKMIRKDGGCIVEIFPHLPTQSSSALGYEILFFEDVTKTDDRI